MPRAVRGLSALNGSVQAFPLGSVAGSRGLICDGDWVESKDQDQGGEVRLIQLADIGVGNYLNKSNRRMTMDAALRLKCTFLKPGDILIARMPDPIGRACIFPGDASPCVTVVDICILRVDCDIAHANYVLQIVNSPAFSEQINRFVKGTTRQRISRTSLEALLVHLPPLQEQRRIAAILDLAGDLRREQASALDLLHDLSQALYRESFVGSGKDKMDWPVVNFGDIVADTKIGLVRSASEFGAHMTYGYVRMNAITREQEIDFSTVMTTEASNVEAHACNLRPGDFLFNTRNSRELVGKSAVWAGPGGYLFNNNLMRIRFKAVADPRYILAAFRDPRIAEELENRKSGTTSVFAIYWNQLKTLPMPLPPIELQTEFAARIADIESLKELQNKRLEKLDALFASLQHRAFDGQHLRPHSRAAIAI